nr:MAG TPA: hypothetical protein [Siphoviridae sp. ct8IY7]
MSVLNIKFLEIIFKKKYKKKLKTTKLNLKFFINLKISILFIKKYLIFSLLQ